MRTSSLMSTWPSAPSLVGMTTFRIVTAVTAGTLTLGLLAGCDGVSLGQRRLDFDQTEEVKITKIAVSPGAGDVAVSTAAVETVRIKRVVRYRGGQPGDTYQLDGTELRIDKIGRAHV